MNSASEERSPRIRPKSKHTGSYCCVPGCFNTRRKDKSRGVELSYHRFPLSDPKRTKLWVDRIRRANWFPKAYDRICSIHFEGGRSDDPKKPGYVPSIFPSSGQKAIKRRTTQNSLASTPTQAKRVCRKIFLASPAFSPSITTSVENSSPRTTSSVKNSYPPSITRSAENSSLPDAKQGNLKVTPEAIPSLKDHDYVSPYVDHTHCNAEMQRLKHEIKLLKQKNADHTPCNAEIDRLKLENITLKQENKDLKKKSLCLDSYKHDDDNFYYMTNLPNYATFEALANYLHKRCNGNLNYWRHQKSSNIRQSSKKKPGRGRGLSFREEMFLVLARLKLGLELKDMNLRTGISSSTLSRIFTTWINFLNNELPLLSEMPPCHEQTISCLEPDSLLSNLPPGSSVVGDHGLQVTEELHALGAEMTMPHFKGGDRPQLSASKVIRSADITSARIHIERVIQRIKTSKWTKTT